MSAEYNQLLDATIQHLEGLKARGVRQVAVTSEALRALSQPVRPALAASFRQQMAAAAAPATMPKTYTVSPSVARPVEAPVVPTPEKRPAAAVAPAKTVFTPPPAAGDKAAAMAALRERALACVRCPNLAAARKNVVFGVGNIDAQLMFVGEAPGADEDAQGEPFVGAAGQLLTKIIQATGLSRADVYIANILKCRPDMPAGASGNRKPTDTEMETCIPYLHEQIDLIRPKVLVALGGTAVEGLLHKTGIMKLRGQWHEYRGIPLMPTYHPAYLLRNQAMAEKRRVWEDMLQVMEKLGMPISQKQRNFFTKA
jgi:uracil-DNA glycosylase family 4